MKKLTTATEQIGSASDLDIGEVIWLTDWKTGLLLEAYVVHVNHVPSKYVEQLSQIESNTDDIVWARVDLGGGHFQWHAVYSESPLLGAEEDIKEEDVFASHHSLNSLKTEG